MLWPLILLIGFLPVSGALWAEESVRGVVGRAITIDCHYEEKYRSHTKYWCHGWTFQCSVLVETNGQHGRSRRVSITDNPERGIFTVTMEDLHSGDTGWYSCGIITPVSDPMFSVHLQVSDEPVSVPVLRYLSPANVSRLGGSVSVSCESFQGSLPIHYTWHEKTSSGYRSISDSKELTLHCQSFNHQHHQYYCSASNQLGRKSSGMVNVTVFNIREICSYVTEINGTISGALWAEDKVRGVVGRTVTINCHYAPMYRSHTKYFCHMWSRQCTSLVTTNGTNEQYGSTTIRDNTFQGIFTVTMEHLFSNDKGIYRCGITTSGNHPVFDVHLQVSDEPVSVPVVRYLSPANVSRLGGSVSVSCESFQGSLPIQYRWYEQTSSGHPKISDTNELTLRCQSFNHTHHQYYCRALNRLGARSSAMVNVTVFNNGGICSYVTEISGTKPPSVPLLQFSPPTSGPSCVDSVSVSCESVHGSLPIQYSWYEKTPSGDSKISDTNKLDLHCQSLKYKKYLYYCKASNNHGEKSSEMVNVSISNNVSTCRNVIEVNSTGPIHFCENTMAESTTTQGPTYIIELTVIGILLILIVVCLLCYLKRKNRESKHHTSHRGGTNETQEMATLEENIVYADLHHVRNNEAAAQLANNENGTVYVNMKFKRKSRAGHSVMDEDNPTYADIKFQSQSTRPK
ncbi:Fc receptor-like protein 5 isoform X2 [Hypanus sabinus]|nr:Fc receptor-like protein 5 isoform X2 [Hypanus sabinus]